MRNLLSVIMAVLSLCVPVLAQDDTEASELRALTTAYEANGWEAVGRLSIGNNGMCTGAMIAPNIVLTAAHCMYDAHSGVRIDPGNIRFHAGWRNGRAAASRQVRRTLVHPDYEFTGPSGDRKVSNDLALLELDSDIHLANITPFKTGDRPRKGETVGVVSYAHDRADTPALQEACHVLARQRGSLILSCDVDFGSSGAPIFSDVGGEVQIVSVVSAKAEIRGRRVSLGTNLEKPLSEMRALMARGGGVSSTPTAQARTVKATTPGLPSLRMGNALNRGSASSNFVRP